MYKKSIFSSEVCKQLACELVTEQAEVVKHQAIIETIKDAIVKKKQQVIEQRLLGKMTNILRYDHLVLDIDVEKQDESILVSVTFGLDPDEVIKIYGPMTRNEKSEFEQYKLEYEHCRRKYDMDNAYEAIFAANRLRTLKNHICLTEDCQWHIDYSQATTACFYQNSGLYTSNYKGNSVETVLLEDLIRKVNR